VSTTLPASCHSAWPCFKNDETLVFASVAFALPNFLSQTEKAKATEAKTKVSSFLKQGHAEWQEAGSVVDTTALAAADTQGKFDYLATPPDPTTSNQIYAIKATANATDPSITGKLAFGCVNLETGKTDLSSGLLDSGTTSDAVCT
jgi:type IV pilus assembly protein PilA